MAAFPIDEVRSRFPGLQRMVDGRQAIFIDGPGGSQAPDSVGDAVRHYLMHQNANVGMSFATSVETDRLIDDGQSVGGGPPGVLTISIPVEDAIRIDVHLPRGSLAVYRSHVHCHNAVP